MRSINYMLICLSCILNWFALAYRPIGTLFSKKVLKKNSMIKVISGLIQSVSSTSLVNFNRKEFSLNMVASTFRGGGNDGQVLFDTSSFLNWWFSGKKTPETMAADNRRLGAEKNLVQSSDSERMSSPSMTMELTSNEKPIFLGKSSSADIVRSSIDSPSFLAGYMDFDPMVAATRSHSNTHQRNRRSSWFNRSD